MPGEMTGEQIGSRQVSPERFGPVAEQARESITRQIGDVRGPVPWSSYNTNEIAKRKGISSPEDFFGKYKAGDALDDEAQTLLDDMTKTWGEDMMEVAKKAEGGDEAAARQLADMQGTFDEMVLRSTQSYSEHGRGLNLARALAQDFDTPGAARAAVLREVNKLRGTGRLSKDSDQALLKRLSEIDPRNPDEILPWLHHAVPPEKKEFVKAYWYASILSGPTTQLRNIVGNVGMGAMENLVTRPLANLISGKAGQGGSRAGAKAWLSAFADKDAWREAGEIFKKGYNPAEIKGLKEAMEGRRNIHEYVGKDITGKKKAGLGNKLLRAQAQATSIPFKALQAMDVIFRGAGRKGELASLLAQGMDPAEAQKLAEEFGALSVFQDDISALGKGVKSVRKAADDLTFGTAGTAVFPFVDVADRLMARGLEYSPVGLARAIAGDRLPDALQVADKARVGARGAVGTGAMGAGALAGYHGLAQGAMPGSDTERELMYAQGMSPFSLGVPGEGSMSTTQLDPLATALSSGISLGENIREGGSIMDILAKTGGESLQGMADRSLASGLLDVSNVFSGRGNVEDRLADFGIRQAAGFIPNIESQLSRIATPGVTTKEGVAEYVKSRISPMLDEPRINMFGEKVMGAETSSPAEFERLSPLSPYRLGQAEHGELAKEMESLIDKDLVGGWSVKKKVYDGEDLTPEQRTGYSQEVGQAITSELESLIANPSWEKFSDKQKAKRWKDAVARGRKDGERAFEKSYF
jgi:hypothetical protein